MSQFFVGYITHLDVPNRRGMVEYQNQKYIFVEQWLNGLAYDDLHLFQSVVFQPHQNEGRFGALQVGKNPNRFKSVISSDLREFKGSHYGFIKRLSEHESKDFNFGHKDVWGNVPLEKLFKGAWVEFEIEEKDDKRYAKNVVVLGQAAGQDAQNPRTPNPQIAPAAINAPQQKDNKNNVDMPQLTQEIVQLLGKQIQQVSHLPFVFEDYAALLLKLMGIPDVHPVPRTQAGGMFDGLFKLQSLEIIYDCTLHTEFETFKKEQIDNYINKIRQSSITINKYTVNLNANSVKQIWVITNGNRSRVLHCTDGIYVKEIVIWDLLRVLEKRMNHSFTTYELAAQLGELGRE